jgi:hypothetical protein
LYVLVRLRASFPLYAAPSDESTPPAPGDKLIFDLKSNRFYEAALDETKEVDEFYLTEKGTGEPILLTRVSFPIENTTIINISSNRKRKRGYFWIAFNLTTSLVILISL